jgi:hypothetical protein
MASSRAINKFLSVAVTLAVLLGILKDFFFATADPYRCNALLSRGTWRDPLDANGSRESFKHWEPEGCMLHKYSDADIRDCLEGRHLLFIGDSTTRQVFWATARQVSHLNPKIRGSVQLHQSTTNEPSLVRMSS